MPGLGADPFRPSRFGIPGGLSQNGPMAERSATDDLLTRPLWRPEDLGRPLPDSPHAVSVALPRWEDVVGYEEKRPEVMERLTAGYPRFRIADLVAELARRLGGGAPCLPFPSARVAAGCVQFVREKSGEEARVVEEPGVVAVVTGERGSGALKDFWQHTGLIVSSRQAEALLAGRPPAADGDEARRLLRRRLASLYDCAEEDVFLAPTGMAAHALALAAVAARSPGRPTVQLGFPYVDTLKLQQKLGAGATLLHDLATVAADLEALLGRQPLAACFCEIPGNPLLGTVDLARVGPLLRARGVPLVVDDVVATPLNVDLAPYADLVVTSLTKYLAGTGDVMGGALVCNPASPLHAELSALARFHHEELLWGDDAVLLESRSRSYPERVVKHNANGLLVAERLRAHPAVEKVWYPKWEDAAAYERLRRPGGGWGSLVSFLPRDAATAAPRVYDRLAVCKGPSLGTDFTLACPFTLLAHYGELEWAESCGVPRHLIRLSVGLEEPEELWSRIDAALTGS